MPPKKFSKMLLLSLLHLSHSADEAERIIFILQLFYETSCSIKRPVQTMRLVVHNVFRFTDSLIMFLVSALTNTIPSGYCF